MQRYMNTHKTCATCNYWTGPRQTERMGQGVVVSDTNARGKCGIPRGGTTGQMKTCAASCLSWMKWSQLK